MKTLLSLLFFVTLTSARSASWLTDLPTAQAQAQREHKSVLINFTGSDWCGWCIKLRQEVFRQAEFDRFANEHLVLVEVDFPKNAEQPASLKRTNTDLASRYRIKGFPTLVILNAQGDELGRSGYKPGGAEPFVQGLAELVGLASPKRAPSVPAPVAVALFNGAPTVPLPRYTNLVLKSVSGTPAGRFALLNNQTFAPGDSLRVKMYDTSVLVHCHEVRERSIVVTVDGEAAKREIKLPQKTR